MTPKERMAEQAKIWGCEMYEGEIRDLDTSLDWYCPWCSHHPKLNRSPDGNTLSCPTYYEICEYDFQNEPERAKRKVVWAKYFRYPLSYLDVLQRRLEAKKETIKRTTEQRRALLKERKECEAEIPLIEAEIAQLKGTQ